MQLAFSAATSSAAFAHCLNFSTLAPADRRYVAGGGERGRIDRRLLYEVASLSQHAGGLSPYDYTIWCYLVRHADSAGCVIRSHARMSDETRVSISKLRGVLDTLADLGWLLVEHRRDGARKRFLSNRYRLSHRPGLVRGVVGPRPALRPYPAAKSLENLRARFYSGSQAYGGRNENGQLADPAAEVARQLAALGTADTKTKLSLSQIAKNRQAVLFPLRR